MAADGNIHPPSGLSARVERELADTSHRVARLPVPVLRTLTPVLAQAQRETAQALGEWLSRAQGDQRYTAVVHRAVLAHLERAFHTIGTLDPTLFEALARAGIDAGRMAAGDASHEFNRFSHLFDQEPTRLPVNVVRIMATGERELIPRFRTSAARYAGDVGADIRRELAVALVRRESISQMTDRLARIGGSKGLVALRGVAGEPGAHVEDIAEGLFARYRYWGERLARTETQRAYNVQVDETLHEAREEIPDLMRRWDASADRRICDVCSELHGAVTTLEGVFPGGYTEAPAHPNCRCRVGAWRRGWEEILSGRAARYPASTTVRTGTLPPPARVPAPPPAGPPARPRAPRPEALPKHVDALFSAHAPKEARRMRATYRAMPPTSRATYDMLAKYPPRAYRYEIAGESWAQTRLRVVDELGDALHVVEEHLRATGDEFRDRAIERNLMHLGFVPEGTLARARAEGVQFYVGNTNVPGLDGMGYLRGVRPRGWPHGETWDNVGGCYDRASRVVIAGDGRGGSASVMIHETGHSLGATLRRAGQAQNLDDDPDVVAAHRRIFSRLSPYEQQGGPGGVAGRHEFFAESIAHMLARGRNAAVARYDEKWVRFCEQHVFGLPRGRRLPDVTDLFLRTTPL